MTTHDSPAQSAQPPEGIAPARTDDLSEQPQASAVSADPSTAPTESTIPEARHSTDALDAAPNQELPPVVPSEPSNTQAPVEVTQDSGAVGESSTEQALFADDELAGLRARWDSVQAAFVDDPKECVHKADGLVSDVVDQLTKSFAETRSRLEGHWARGEDASTEDLRLALKRYRDFFDRLLAV
jgi:hypothetical protein